MSYSVETPLSAAAWLALSEQERIDLVAEAHRATGSPTGARPDAHAAIHVVVENQLAEGLPAAVRAYERLRAAGLKRHTAVHALASVVTEHMLAAVEDRALDEAAMNRDFDALDPARFTAPPRSGRG